MTTRNIVVVGTSAGGMRALKVLVSQIPANFPAAVFIVQHLTIEFPSILDRTLQAVASVPVSTAIDGETIENGRIYVAPADYHLILEKSVVRVTRGPRENRFRPSVDVLFRSAAVTFGPRVIGIVLTGLLDDGASGLLAIKQQGGIAVVQDPVEAEFPDMPLNAMRTVKVDYSIGLVELGILLVRLVSEEIDERGAAVPPKNMLTEVDIAKGKNALERTLAIGEKTSLTCPECHGSLVEIREDKLVRFRCHTGHAYSLGSLMEDLAGEIETALWLCLSRMDENELLMNRASAQLNETGETEAAKLVNESVNVSRRQSNLIRQALLLPKEDAKQVSA